MQKSKTMFLGILSGDQRTQFSFILLKSVKVIAFSPPSMLENQTKQILSVLYQCKDISEVGQTGKCMQKLRMNGEANVCLLENRGADPLPMHTGHLYSPQKNMSVSEIGLYLRYGENRDNSVEFGLFL